MTAPAGWAHHVSASTLRGVRVVVRGCTGAARLEEPSANVGVHAGWRVGDEVRAVADAGAARSAGVCRARTRGTGEGFAARGGDASAAPHFADLRLELTALAARAADLVARALAFVGPAGDDLVAVVLNGAALPIAARLGVIRHAAGAIADRGAGTAIAAAALLRRAAVRGDAAASILTEGWQLDARALVRLSVARPSLTARGAVAREAALVREASAAFVVAEGRVSAGCAPARGARFAHGRARDDRRGIFADASHERDQRCHGSHDGERRPPSLR